MAKTVRASLDVFFGCSHNLLKSISFIKGRVLSLALSARELFSGTMLRTERKKKEEIFCKKYIDIEIHFQYSPNQRGKERLPE
ncbi:hypothetical protein [uncultured Mailhella sp.]|uniref:hypothetical protein n=1 Tax=uncultured Mailhella sp. TaxID=1981031 RepID=UPI002613E577|nr:hypothetical protein [uncultured Mailhella sp.]